MTQRYLVGIADYLTESSQELAVLADCADVKVLGADTEERLLAAADSFDALLVYHSTKVTERVDHRHDEMPRHRSLRRRLRQRGPARGRQARHRRLQRPRLRHRRSR